MDSDHEDVEDNKYEVRSAIDALGATLKKNGEKRRGRPRKYPLGTSSTNSGNKKTRQPSESDSGAGEQSEEEEDDFERSAKKRRRGSDDEEWNEQEEELTATQRRTRKKPTLYSEESVAREEEQRRQQMGKRPRGGGRAGGNRYIKQYHTGQQQYHQQQPTYNQLAPAITYSEEEQKELDGMKQIWRDIQNPQQAKHRIMSELRRGMFEKALHKVTPTFNATSAVRPRQTMMDDVLSVFDKLGCSAGFLEFLNNISEVALVAVYDVCNQLFVLTADVPDNVAIAQSLRFWWNTLSYAKRRQWEEHARKLVSDAFNRDPSKSIDGRPTFGSTEVQVGKVSKKRLADEEEWDKLRSGPLAVLDQTDPTIICPLCEKDNDADQCRMRTIREIQDHFFHYHWQVHGYACHYCGMMYSTADELRGHLDCPDFVSWNTSRLLSGAGVGKMTMKACRMLLCCSDCGWYAPLSRKDRRSNEEGTMKYLKAFMSHHNNDGLLAMIVYFPATPSAEMTSIRFPVTSVCGGDPQAPCLHCDPPVPFRDPSEANEHHMKEHRDKALVCGECKAMSTTNFLLKQHQMEHVHENSYFADYLTNSARVFPPPTNLSSAPRSGWKDRTQSKVYAYGGVRGGVSDGTGYDPVNPMEFLSDVKARHIRQRKREGKPAYDEGFEDVYVQEESDMARKVREKLRRKYSDCDGMGFDDTIWFKDEDALKFKEWMDEWETAEGRKMGGPPRTIEFDLTPSILKIPTVEVELKFAELDVLSGFLLNENVYFCTHCNTILKGEQATEHLQLKVNERNECAIDADGEVQANPKMNSKMVQLYYVALSSSDVRLSCPLCPSSACSINGLRIHVMVVHGHLVNCKKAEGEAVTDAMALKFDIRSRLARSIDHKLKMQPSGMLAQRKPINLEPSSLSATTWSGILYSRENTDAAFLQNLQTISEEAERTAQDNLRFAAPAMPRGRPPRPVTNYNIQPSRGPMMSLEQSLQMRNAIQQGRPYNPSSTPLGRPISSARGGRGGGATATVSHVHRSLVRLGAPHFAQQQGPAFRKLVDVHHRGGDRTTMMTCKVCANGDQHEAEMVKGHLMRCHLNTCGHCTAIFVFEQEARAHARKCRIGRDKNFYYPDPRLPHVLTNCPFCPAQLPMAELHMHLLDMHIQQLDYELPSGKLNVHIKLVHAGRPGGDRLQPEVERLRFKYYVPKHEVARNSGFRQCHVCGLQLPDAAKLNLHLRHHSEFMYFCWLCPRPQSAEMGSVSEIVRHIIGAHLKGNQAASSSFLPCPNCKLNIATRPLMHLLYECDYNFTCQLCRDLPTFESETELKEHKDKCHYDTLRRFECSDCTAYFSTSTDFVRHVCDPTMMTTTCTCQQAFKTRALFNQHFMVTHLRGDICRICAKTCKNGDEQRNHMYNHGTTHRPTEERHMLICAYGNQSNEQRTLLTHVSNASFRLRNVARATGGTQDAPVVLSDDDDDIIIEEMPTEAELQQQKQQKQRARTSSSSDHSVDPAADADAVVQQVVRRMIKSVVESEEIRIKAERRVREASEKSDEKPIDLADAIELNDDDDIMMVDDPETDLSARVRVEAEDTVAVGGQNLPGYQDDDDGDAPNDARPAKPVIREFTPGDDDDDDLCVVAEVENPGFTAAAATISKQREKKFGCTKCSSRFMTHATLANHLRTAHQHDAGTTTIMDELGIPRKATLWICKSCCLAFPTPELKKAHADGHGQRSYGCESCSGCAYNLEVMAAHHRRVQENKVAFVCGECKIEFDNDTCLHEHSSTHHGVMLFYFCKVCEMGSTEHNLVYDHFMTSCPQGFNHIAKVKGIKAQDDAWKCIGVCPAAQLHYQPASLDKYKHIFAQNPSNFVKPSVCNHRSLCVAMERQVSCTTCRCLENMQRHTAMYKAEHGREYDEKAIRVSRSPAPPLANVRIYYEEWLRERREERQRQEMMSRLGQGSSQMQHNGRQVMITPGQQHHPQQGYQQHGYRAQEAQRTHNDRILAAQMARGGGRMPVLAACREWNAQGMDGGGAMMNNQMQMQQYNIGGGPLQQLMRGPNPRQQQHTPYNVPQYRVHAPHHQAHNRPTVTPGASLSTMGSLQAIAAAATANGGGNSASSSAQSTPPPVAAPAFSSNCKICSKTCTSQREAFLHTHHQTDRAFVCHRCPMSMKTEKDAVKHIMNHINPIDRELDMDMDCPFATCGAVQPTLLALKGHIAHHNPPLSNRIASCYTVFGTTALARAHEEAHMRSGRDAGECCILCGSMDNWESEMVDTRGKGITVKHIMKHAMKHKYHCKICMTRFDEENQIVTHYIMNHMQDEGASRSCKDCREYNLRTENDYKIHCMTKHTITELFTPRKLMVKIPQTFNDYLGIEQ